MNDADELIASALAENECGFVVYDHHDTNIGPASHHTYDAWTEAPVEDSGFTTFEDTGASFEDWMIGWLLVPDVHQLAYLEIVDVDDTAGTVTVKGNAENMAADGTQYWLVAPTGVSATHGALETDPCAMGNPWLWAGYHYRPPVAGFSDPEGQDPGVYGKQNGQNQAGTYDCWNRVYEPQTGRWTTPDPLQDTWVNVHSYSSNFPTRQSDPNGLQDTTNDKEHVVAKKAKELISHGRYCGPGGGPGEPVDAVDKCCKEHDDCFAKIGIDWADYTFHRLSDEKAKLAYGCNVTMRQCLRKAKKEVDKKACRYADMAHEWFERVDFLYQDKIERASKKEEESLLKKQCETQEGRRLLCVENCLKIAMRQFHEKHIGVAMDQKVRAAKEREWRAAEKKKCEDTCKDQQ
ncbi:MAG: hypothetical protein KF696_01345 [Planctomycetes bacterium]|nr:hypothetical protein [Planctomycetota bacterium]MCW8134415.1 hypothetical protein [Planctomycetota bacterium]